MGTDTRRAHANDPAVAKATKTAEAVARAKTAMRRRRSASEKLLMSVGEAAQELDIAERQAWALVGTGALGSIKIGKSRRVAWLDIEQFIERNRVPGYAVA